MGCPLWRVERGGVKSFYNPPTLVRHAAYKVITAVGRKITQLSHA